MTDPHEEQGRGGSYTAPSTSTSLLLRAQNRDTEAWQRLARLYYPVIFHWCHNAGLQADDATDVTQEVLRALLAAIDDYRREGGRNSFRGWLWGITRHKLADFHRRLQRETPGQGGTTAHRRLEQQVAAEQPPGEEDEDLSLDDPVVRQAWDIIQDEFTPPTQQAFWQTTVDGRAPADVAADLGITTNAVYLARSRVLGRLRQELEGLRD